MFLYRVTFLCPDCGKTHRLSYHARGWLDAVNKFKEYWREFNNTFGFDTPLPKTMSFTDDNDSTLVLDEELQGGLQ